MKPLKTTAEITFRQLAEHDSKCEARLSRAWVVPYPSGIDTRRDASGRANRRAYNLWLRVCCNDRHCPARAIVSLAFLAELPMGERRKGKQTSKGVK